MKTRVRELAKPGIYGTVDNPKVVTEQDLREIAETFAEIGKAPVSLNGHYWIDPSKPRMGNVIAVSFDEATKVLSGTVEEQDVLADAVDEGFYPDVSIRGERRAVDSKMYLHHLAYLGEEPPAIKDLVNNIQKDLGIAASDDTKGLVIFPSMNTELRLSDPYSTAPKQDPAKPGTNPKKEGTMDEELKKAQSDLEAEKAKNKALSEKLAKIAAKYPDEISLSDAPEDPRIASMMADARSDKVKALLDSVGSRIPKAKHGLITELAGHLSVSKNIELSDGKGGKEKVSGLDLLARVLESLPELVKTGRVDLSDDDGDGGDAPIDMRSLLSRA